MKTKGLRMIRGFLSGIFWGTVVAALGLGTISQLTPLPVERIVVEATRVPRVKPVTDAPVAVPAVSEAAPEPAVIPDAAPAAEAPAADAAAPVAEEAEPAAEEAVPAAEEAVLAAEEAAPAAEEAAPAVVEAVPAAEAQLDPPAGSEFAKPLPESEVVLPAPDAKSGPKSLEVAPMATPVPEVATPSDQPATAPETGQQAPASLGAPAEEDAAKTLTTAGDAAKTPLVVPGQLSLPQKDMAPVPVADPAPQVAAEPEAKPEAEQEEALLKPLPEALPEPEPETAPVQEAVVEPEPQPEILPVPEPAEEPAKTLEPDPVLVPEAEPATPDAPKTEATLEPTPGLSGEVDGVIVGRLPRIGDAVPAPEGEAVPGAESAAAVLPEVETEKPPLQKYARVFENLDGKAVFSIILIDTGGDDVDRAALAALPFPVSFALDPMAPNAAAASKIYRDAGQEVIMVATGIPSGATASDLEVTFQSNAAALPEAVAVLDMEFGAFQADRPLATQVVPILKAQGRGLITWDRGLNAADQVARRDGLAAGMVFRKLDGKGENTAAIRRALDRAAFKAAQDGRVIVIGQTLPETVAALVDWSVEGRAASVALAPISAALIAE